MDGQTSPATYPTHQKNSTWDAFMWSSKLQLPSLGEPLSPSLPTSTDSGVFPTHRRGASMPPQLEEDLSLPPIRYFDDEPRPRLGHRARNTFSSLGTDSDWTTLQPPAGSTSGSETDSVLVAEPPPTHRRGGSTPMVPGFGLSSSPPLSDGIFSTSTQSNGVRPQHRRSVTFQGLGSRSSDLFDFDSLKLESPARLSTPPPPSSAGFLSSTSATPSMTGGSGSVMGAAAASASKGVTTTPVRQSQPMATSSLPAPPPHISYGQQPQQVAMPPQQSMHYAPSVAQHQRLYQTQQQSPSMIAVSPMLPQFAPYPNAAASGPGGYDANHDMRGGAGMGQMDPNVQMQLQMQQALLVQQQQWIMAMQQQQLQQQKIQQQRAPTIYQHMSSPVPNGANGKQPHPHSPVVPSGSKHVGAGSDPVLSEYKSTGMRPKAEDLIGHVQAFAMDAHGSRFLQYQMEIARPEDKDMLVSESLPCAVALMQDTFGNYVIQNFLEHATPGSRRRIAETMKGHMLALSMQPHGCRVVQRAFDLVDIDQRNELLGELLIPKGNVSQAARNTHATHVLQKTVSILRRDSALEQQGETRLKGSIDLMHAMEKAIADDVIQLLLHPHAYRLVLNVLGDCDVTRSPHVAQAVDTISANRDLLCVDQHGNFMLQHMLDNTQSEGVLDYVQSRIVELAQHKFGSHLVEKCFAVASPERCQTLVEEMIRPTAERNLQATKKLLAGDSSGFATQSPALALMKDPYANFVVQKAFDRVQPGALKQELVTLVQTNADLLQKFTYGRHILAHVTSSQRSQASGSPVNNAGSSSPIRSAAGSPSGGPRNMRGGGGHHRQGRGNMGH